MFDVCAMIKLVLVYNSKNLIVQKKKILKSRPKDFLTIAVYRCRPKRIPNCLRNNFTIGDVHRKWL